MTVTVYGYELWQAGLALWAAGSLVSAFAGGVSRVDQDAALLQALFWPLWVVGYFVWLALMVVVFPLDVLFLAGVAVASRLYKPGVPGQGPAVDDGEDYP